MIICFFFLHRQQGVFGTKSNIYGGAFLWKRLAAKSPSLFLQKSSTIDFLLGSKYSSWQCFQKKLLKDISPVLSNFLRLYSYNAYFTLSHKSEKCVTERKNVGFEVYLLTRETNSWFLLIKSLNVTCATSYG